MKNRLERVRKGKYFKPSDLVLYGVVVIIVVAAFLTAFLTKEKTELQKIEIYYQEKLLYIHDFSKKDDIITDTGKNFVEICEGEKGTEVTVRTPKGYNTVLVDEKGASIIAADCSVNADCVKNFDKITAGGQAIFCLPHEIKVVGIGEGNEVVL